MVNVGKWSFLVGVIIAILTGFFNVPNLAIILLILGLIVGFLNISGEEATSYLIATIALLLVGFMVSESFNYLNVDVAAWVNTVLGNFVTFVATSSLIVAIKVILALGSPNKNK